MDLPSQDTIAFLSVLASTFTALAAIGITVFHERQRRSETRRDRAEDFTLEAQNRARAHLLEVLVTNEPGLRNVEALGNYEGDALSDILEKLGRTATQLEVVGESTVAGKLRTLCDQWPEADATRQKALQGTFVSALKSQFDAATK